ncbi:hypothetical protein [Microcystis phage Mwe-JY05]
MADTTTVAAAAADAAEQLVNGVAQTRPTGDSGYFLAVGSTRVRGHRFRWGQELPSPEGKELADRGYAVDDAAKLRLRDGSPAPAPAVTGALGGLHSAAHDTGATVEVTDSAGVHPEETTSDPAEGATTPVNDSQSGSTTRRRTAK